MRSSHEIAVRASGRVVLILTAIGAETEAVLGHMSAVEKRYFGGTWGWAGTFGDRRVNVIEAGVASARSAAVAAGALTDLNPDIAAFVGIAGGIKDVVLGDVVVATKVYNYQAGKEVPGVFLVRPDMQSSHFELEARARVVRQDRTWSDRMKPAYRRRQPTVHIGPIAAGDAVVAANDGQIATRIHSSFSDALAVEMEGRGFLEAAHLNGVCRAVVVRGISDLLVNKNRADARGWQRRASEAAAAFFFAMLAIEAPARPPEDDLKTANKPLEKTSTTSPFIPNELRKTMSNPKYASDLDNLHGKNNFHSILNGETIIIVVGTSLYAELLDRPPAEKLREIIDERGKSNLFRRAIIITDISWDQSSTLFRSNPVIAIGSPSANKLSKKFAAWDPPAPWCDLGLYEIGGRQSLTGFFRTNSAGMPEAAAWGHDAKTTRLAVECFAEEERGLSKFLDHAWK